MRRRPCGESWHEHLRSRSLVADRGVRPDSVVVPPPALDDDLGLAESVEDFAPIGERDGVIRRERLEPNLDPMRAIRKRSPGWRCPF